MADEGKGVALAILGVVAVIAVVGLVLLFTGATARVAQSAGVGYEKLYTRQSEGGYYGGAADVENPYYGYYYETYQGVGQSRSGVGDYTAGGGNWGDVYGESPYEGATEPYTTAPQVPGVQAPTTKRAPESIPSGQICANSAGFCPYGSVCQPDLGRVGSNWLPVSGYDGCYVVRSGGPEVGSTYYS